MRLPHLLSLALLLIFLSCKREPKAPEAPDWNSMTIELSCIELESADSSPFFAVYLQAGDRKTKVAEINSSCNGITREEFPAYEIPDQAIHAIGGWRAGAGDYFYVVAEEGKIVVYQGEIDEMQETTGYGYQLIATYDGNKFNLIK